MNKHIKTQADTLFYNPPDNRRKIHVKYKENRLIIKLFKAIYHVSVFTAIVYLLYLAY